MTLPLLVAALLTAAIQDPPPTTQPSPPAGIGTMVYVDGDAVIDYRPEPALRVAETSVAEAAFPAVDIHCHWNLDVDPQLLLRAMDERNVHRAVNLSGGHGPELMAMLERFHRAAPGRLIIFCNIDFSKIDEPDFGEQAGRTLREAAAAGAAGLKIFKSLGLRITDASGELVAIDDRRLSPIWRTCGELGWPVLLHSADPVAFFAPVDGRNERWMQLRRHRDWSFHGEQFPSREALLAQRDRLLARHRETTFICAHMGGFAEDLEAAGRFLDDHPNAVLDISGRVAELGRQPYSARRLLIRHQDRILFGTDRYPGRPDQPRDRIYFRFLETDDEYFSYYDHAFPPAGDWRIYGLFLPDPVLDKIYRRNAERVLGYE